MTLDLNGCADLISAIVCLFPAKNPILNFQNFEILTIFAQKRHNFFGLGYAHQKRKVHVQKISCFFSKFFFLTQDTSNNPPHRL